LSRAGIELLLLLLVWGLLMIQAVGILELDRIGSEWFFYLGTCISEMKDTCIMFEKKSKDCWLILP